VKYLILGGARSGKSQLSESIAIDAYKRSDHCRLHYIATAVVCDSEMKLRIEEHQNRRCHDEWIEHECSIQLCDLIADFNKKDIVLVDCLTAWLNNIIYNDNKAITQEQIQNRIKQLVKVVSDSKATLIFVSNEVGLGVVPLGEITRLFVDNTGWMNQAFATELNTVILVTAGIPMVLKG